PPAVEGRHRDVEALALLVQQPVAAHASPFDREIDRGRRVESEFLLLARDADLVAVEHERRDALRPGRLWIGTGEEQHGPAEAAVGDPLLRTRDRPAVLACDRGRPQRTGI